MHAVPQVVALDGSGLDQAVAAQCVAAYYKPQLDAYAECLAAATGAAVRTVLLFLHPDGSIESAVP